MKTVLIVYFVFLSFFHLTGQSTSSEFYDRYSAAIESGQYQSGIAIAQEWKDQFQSEVKAYYYAAVACAKTGRKTQAIQNLEKALLIDSTHVPSLISLAELSKRSSGRKSLLLYEKLLAINPANAYFYREAAETAVDAQKFDKAIAYYSMAYQMDSLDLITLTGFCQLLVDFKQFADADSLLNRAIELDPSNRYARLTKAKLAFAAE
ncbi:MAG TPA: tetratricopeptide repeat protein, partial [Cryomorphaceae bacterium]|nr:tetratricopeptide repeat protein [Cryomorphaceae bacterium]